MEPKISFCIFTYNQAHFVREAINSVINQTILPWELIISDDCSTDETFEIIQKTVRGYNGGLKIVLNRNSKNLGIGGHFSTICEKLVTGDYIIILGGDDMSKLNHVEVALNIIQEYKSVLMYDFNGDIINTRGEVLRVFQILDFEIKNYTIKDYLGYKTIQSFAPGRIFHYSLFEKFGKISNNCPTEDSVLMLRSLLSGGFMRINKSLIYYRQHENNVSKKENLNKISNLTIISQYYIDTLEAFKTNIIDELLAKKILRRINIEYKIRDQIYKSNTNIIGRIKIRLLIFFEKILSKI